MYTIKYFTEKIKAVATARELNERGYKSNAINCAQFLCAYCRYIKDVLSSFQIVAIKVTISYERTTLTVDYGSGSSSIPMEHWYEQVLLPAIEAIASNHNNRVIYNYITKSKAA